MRPDESSTRRANRAEWDRYADDYQAAHGEFLGDDELTWSPEGLREPEAGLLGDVAGLDVLEIGCGAAQGARWAARQGARAVGVDLSWRQLQHARRIDAERPALVQATATALPFADAAFDLAFSAYGAFQFVADLDAALGEVRRVLRPGGRLVASVTHPIRWCFPDDPGARGLVAERSYWDDEPYVERDADGALRYVEHHRTLGAWVSALTRSGLSLTGLLEPEWPDGHDRDWDGWSRLRGRVLPGTAILSATTR